MNSVPKTCRDLLERENAMLAPYAFRADGAGTERRNPEPKHPFRTEFQRDRDRVLHSKAFRRLEYKTQVFLNGSGDHLRNRLTHTIEVAAIARTIAQALGLNEDLTEAVALAHDLGHTPFGHSGERTMAVLMADYGGFDHNLQALRVIDHLEIKYPEYDGINLTIAAREALIKHRMPGMSALDGRLLPPKPCLEAQVADLADDLTYYGHDVDDGLDSGILKPEMLDGLEIWQRANAQAEKYSYLYIPGENRQAAYTVRCLIDMMVGDAIRHSAELLNEYAPESPEAVMQLPKTLISFSPEFQKLTDQLKKFLYQNLYFAPELTKLNDLSQQQLSYLFEHYCSHPEAMLPSAQARIGTDGLHRAVCDEIAGMTDNYAVNEYLRLK